MTMKTGRVQDVSLERDSSFSADCDFSKLKDWRVSNDRSRRFPLQLSCGDIFGFGEKCDKPARTDEWNRRSGSDLGSSVVMMKFVTRFDPFLSRLFPAQQRVS